MICSVFFSPSVYYFMKIQSWNSEKSMPEKSWNSKCTYLQATCTSGHWKARICCICSPGIHQCDQCFPFILQRLITQLQCWTEFSPSAIAKQNISENLYIFINSTKVIRMSTYIFFYYLFCISFLNFEWKIIFVFKLWESKAGLNSV